MLISVWYTTQYTVLLDTDNNSYQSPLNTHPYYYKPYHLYSIIGAFSSLSSIDIILISLMAFLILIESWYKFL
jgi:hypothetical protein